MDLSQETDAPVNCLFEREPPTPASSPYKQVAPTASVQVIYERIGVVDAGITIPHLHSPSVEMIDEHIAGAAPPPTLCLRPPSVHVSLLPTRPQTSFS